MQLTGGFPPFKRGQKRLATRPRFRGSAINCMKKADIRAEEESFNS